MSIKKSRLSPLRVALGGAWHYGVAVAYMPNCIVYDPPYRRNTLSLRLARRRP